MKFSVATIGRYIPLLAILYSVWQAYGQRGVQGLMEDLKDIPNMIKYKDDLMRLAIGVVVIVGGSVLVQKFVPSGIIRYVLIGVVYMTGTSMILEAIRSGSSGPFGFFGAGPAQTQAAANALQGMN